MGRFFAELNRRNVVRVAGIYVVVGWLLIQVAATLEEAMSLPAWFDGLVVALLIVGLPIALVFAWAFELTPEGIVRTADVPADASITRETGRKLDILILVAIVALGIITLWPGTREPGEVPAAAIAAADDKSVAVLPFTNRSSNPEDAFFADGIHDDLLTHLSKLGGLQVISRTSVMGYAGTEKRIPDIARELGVATVMEGAVQRAGNRVRINVQLIDGDTDAHLWAETYDRALTADNIFEIQSEITRAIAGALNAVLSDTEQRELDRQPTRNVDAYAAYLSGRLKMQRYSVGEAAIHEAIAAFDRAIELDPGFAQAWASRAIAQVAVHWHTSAAGDWVTPAERSLERARALAPDAFETLTAEGYIYYWGHLDYERADAAFARALEKSPNAVDAINGKAFAARRAGRYADSVELLETASRLDPLNFDATLALAETYAELGRFADARAALARALALDGGAPIFPLGVANVWDAMGDLDRVWQALGDPAAEVRDDTYFPRVRWAIATRERSIIEQSLDSWPENLRSGENVPEDYAIAKASALLFFGEQQAADALLAAAKARTDARDIPYPQGWKANAIYYPVELPGLMGDLDGVRAAVADYESNVVPDTLAEGYIRQIIAAAFVRCGDADAAFAQLARMEDIRGPWIYPRLTIDFALDPLHGDPRWQALEARYEAWSAKTGEHAP